MNRPPMPRRRPRGRCDLLQLWPQSFARGVRRGGWQRSSRWTGSRVCDRARV